MLKSVFRWYMELWHFTLVKRPMSKLHSYVLLKWFLDISLVFIFFFLYFFYELGYSLINGQCMYAERRMRILV